jgi:hypothetical protein
MQALAALGAAGLGAAVAFVASPARRSPKRPAADVIDPDDGSADEADRVVLEVADEAAELAEALEDADDQVVRTKGGRGVKKGKHAARRQEGCDRNLIGRELALGCGCKHGCLDHITVGEVLEARSEKVDYSPAQIREWIRGFLLGNPCESKLGVRLHSSTSADVELCAHGFDIYHGLSLGYTYRHIRALKDGIVLDHDDHGRGGAGGGDGFPDDSQQFMVSTSSTTSSTSSSSSSIACICSL